MIRHTCQRRPLIFGSSALRRSIQNRRTAAAFPLNKDQKLQEFWGGCFLSFFLQGFEVWRIKEWGIMMTPCCTLVNFTNESLDWLLELCLGSSYDKWVEVLFTGYGNKHNSQHQSESVFVHRGKSEFPWDIETKYYKASICIKVKQVVLSSFLHAFKQLNWYFVKNLLKHRENQNYTRTCVLCGNMYAGIKKDLLIIQYFKKSFRICGSQSIKKYISN